MKSNLYLDHHHEKKYPKNEKVEGNFSHDYLVSYALVVDLVKVEFGIFRLTEKLQAFRRFI